MRYMLLFSVIAIVALGIVGLSSATWSASNRVEGTVQMGTIDYRLADPEVDYRPPGHRVTASISPDGHALVIVFNKPSRGDYAEVLFSVRNTGTVPLKVNGLIVSAPGGIRATTFGAGAVVAPGDCASGFGIEMSVVATGHSTLTVTLTLDCRQWTY